MKRRWILIIVFVVLAIVVPCWFASRSQPVEMHFTGFDRAGLDLVARFVLQNHSAKKVEIDLHAALAETPNSIPFAQYVRVRTKEEITTIAPGDTLELQVPMAMKLEDRALQAKSVSVGIRVYHLRPPLWDSAPLRWLPSRLKPAANGIFWSEPLKP